ncbi:hypothetical protein EVAR_48532_1 [Eumeta japonica]|uniref:Uncharacterized protein n=1 Tax=Eumeta variegata TaxID=151549 RepID=A0A4C1YBM8_EUMVA|nr:hypothetical protein EVAR_48532_1 [Eumeta japonica]
MRAAGHKYSSGRRAGRAGRPKQLPNHHFCAGTSRLKHLHMKYALAVFLDFHFLKRFSAERNCTPTCRRIIYVAVNRKKLKRKKTGKVRVARARGPGARSPGPALRAHALRVIEACRLMKTEVSLGEKSGNAAHVTRRVWAQLILGLEETFRTHRTRDRTPDGLEFSTERFAHVELRYAYRTHLITTRAPCLTLHASGHRAIPNTLRSLHPMTSLDGRAPQCYIVSVATTAPPPSVRSRPVIKS